MGYWEKFLTFVFWLWFVVVLILLVNYTSLNEMAMKLI